MKHKRTHELRAAVLRLVGTVMLFLMLTGWMPAAELQTIKLNEPNKKRGLPLMETLSVKASAREYSDQELSLQDLSDLLWAACGINRPDEKKTTASSAQNAQDIDLYVFMKDGVYIYHAGKHELIPVLVGDFRSQIIMAHPPRPAGAPTASPASPPPPTPAPSNPPIQLILVSDADRFRASPPERRYEWGAIDAGIVS